MNKIETIRNLLDTFYVLVKNDFEILELERRGKECWVSYNRDGHQVEGAFSVDENIPAILPMLKLIEENRKEVENLFKLLTNGQWKEWMKFLDMVEDELQLLENNYG